MSEPLLRESEWIHIETSILERFDVVKEIGVFRIENALHAVILPNFEAFQERGILNMREYMRLDVIDRHNRRVPDNEKIRGFLLVKEPLSILLRGQPRQQGLLALYQSPKTVKSSANDDQPKFPEYRLIHAFVEQLLQQEVAADDHLEIDVALSSLEKVQLCVFLEKAFGVVLADQELLDHLSVESLAHYIHSKTKRISEQLPQRVTLESVRWDKILLDHQNFSLPVSRLTHDIVLKSTEIFARCYFRLQGAGMEHIPESPVILAANHQCFFDGFILARFLPHRFMKNSYVFAVEKHFSTPFRRFVANTSNVIIVNINRDLKTSLQKMAAVVQKGSNVVIFPEGTRTKDGKLGAFKPTFAILSKEFRVPIVPVAISGGFDAMPIGSRFPKPLKEISVTFLPPVFPEDLSYHEISDQVRQAIATTVYHY